MKLSFPEFEDVVSPQEVAVFDNGRYEEIVQMLSDLGYLTISPEEGKISSHEELRNAVYTFRKEATACSLDSKSSLLLPFPDDPREDHDAILTYREFSVLQLLTSLDGDFTLKPLHEIKNLEIYTRVLQYRLHLLGLFATPPDGCFSSELTEAFEKLSGWLPAVNQAKLPELTGDISNLIIRIRESEVFEGKIIYFRFATDSSRFYSITGNNRDFMDQLRKDIGRKSDGFRQLKEKSKYGNVDREFLDAQCDDEKGRFLVRLLQLQQWVSGYYLGTVDGDLGKFTFSSFLELAQGEAESGNSDFRMNLLVGHIADQYWVANPHYLFGEYTTKRAEYSPGMSEVFDVWNEKYQQLDDDGRKTVDENMRQAWKSVNVGFSSDLKSSSNRFRRIYYGAKSLLKSFLRGMKNIFRKLRDKVIDLLSGMFNLVKNFAKFMYREIREALHIFSRGLKFLFGNRQLSTGDCLTKFDFDLDSISVIPAGLSRQMAENHSQLMIATTTGLTFCLTLTGRIIHAILLLTLSWPKLILEAGVMLKKLVQESYAQKEYAGFAVVPQG